MSFYISRFKGMEQREFEVEIVTPLFLGGSDPKKAELRVPSIKGALRFWWRALYGSDDLQDMKKQEGEIFGSTDKKASFSIQLKGIENICPARLNLPQGLRIPTQSRGRTFPISIVEYLAYGLCEYDRTQRKNVYTKEHLPVGTRFVLQLNIYNTSHENQIVDALKTLGNFGGAGSRSRNGFGCLKIDNLAISPKSDLKVKSFASFSKQTLLFDKFKPMNKWEDALSEIGKVYRASRISLEGKHIFIKRPLIAKPLIVKNEIAINERHAKPYFLHVNKLVDGKYQGQILFMPYNYHDEAKRKKYFETCNQMNQKIIELSGGPR
ncbi:MAG: type III-B CRISPR module RAMP protein Cmr1 [Desulfobacterales bacterium RIFOXYA12_FULL_46_15]|nr:MAG: type III-B CRISPR module RAMP protein Cmr1 [Desulfobacterales bacterium RIFOXYA12_FULL_46_15]